MTVQQQQQKKESDKFSFELSVAILYLSISLKVRTNRAALYSRGNSLDRTVSECCLLTQPTISTRGKAPIVAEECCIVSSDTFTKTKPDRNRKRLAIEAERNCLQKAGHFRGEQRALFSRKPLCTKAFGGNSVN